MPQNIVTIPDPAADADEVALVSSGWSWHALPVLFLEQSDRFPVSWSDFSFLMWDEITPHFLRVLRHKGNFLRSDHRTLRHFFGLETLRKKGAKVPIYHFWDLYLTLLSSGASTSQSLERGGRINSSLKLLRHKMSNLHFFPI